MHQVATVKFGNFQVVCSTRREIAEAIAKYCESNTADPFVIFDVNGHALSLAKTDESYAKALNKASLIHADGGFLIPLSVIFSKNAIPERSATTDMIHDLADEAFCKSVSYYLLGGTETVNNECTHKLRQMYPNLSIKGHRHGYFEIEEERSICDEIRRSGANVVWIGLGKPKEQLFIERNLANLSGLCLITCGGCFNYITGEYKRAPKWMQTLCIEWLFRLISDPRKLGLRYLKTTPHALFIALTENDLVSKLTGRTHT